MEPLELQLAARLLADALIVSKERFAVILELIESGGFAKLGADAMLAGTPPAYLSAVRLPWPRHKAMSLAPLFRWEGVDSAVEAGFYGTSVSRDPEGRPCIRVYCNSRAEGFFRERVLGKFEFDVGVIFAQGDPIRFAQSYTAPGGSKIGARAGLTKGTLGGWLRSTQLDMVGISNNHVAADLNNFWPRDIIVGHPSPHERPVVLGQLARVFPLRVHDPQLGTGNLADVACLTPFDTKLVDPTIDNRLPRGEADLIALWDSGIAAKIWMLGQASASDAIQRGADPVQRGVVKGVHATVWWNRQRTFVFDDQIELAISAKDGDSGSLVLTQDDDKIGGLFFAIRENEGYINPWARVKAAIRLDFVYR